jgi:murein DD-endopeptidase MepM/ murein hydrolase activator NlpD
MKLTVTLIGKNRRLRRSFSVRSIVSLTVLSSLFVLVSSRSTESTFENTARVKVAQNMLQAEKREVAELKQSTQAQMQVVIEQLAQLQMQIDKLDSQSESLVSELGLQPEALNEFKPAAMPLASGKLMDNPLLASINNLGQQLAVKSQQLQALESLITGYHIDEQISLSGRPIETGWLSSYYGMRVDPFTGNPAMHKGIDFAGKSGDQVVATAAGIVSWAGERYGYGNLVEIEHGDGIITRYGHNDSLMVKAGDLVTKGQEIALMGNTGRSTGAHVHYEVIKNGQQIDPLPYVYKK